jgi:hypothetical protein
MPYGVEADLLDDEGTDDVFGYTWDVTYAQDWPAHEIESLRGLSVGSMVPSDLGNAANFAMGT